MFEDQDDSAPDSAPDSAVISANVCRERLRNICRNIRTEYFEVCELVWMVADNKWFHLWGYDSLDQFGEEELGFNHSKINYFRNIWDKLHVKMGFSREDLMRIEWSKAAALLPLAKRGLMDNKDEWIENACKATTADLRARVQEKLGRVSDGETLIRQGFGLYPKQKEIYDKALEKARQVSGSDKMPRLIEVICLEFLSASYDSKSLALDEFLRRVEEVFDVRCIAIDKRGNLVCGEDVVL